ncbi:ATP-binding protein [Streptomyces sp. S1]|uniref:ATP-binding protein n=1 Tax=Streptomyces sp. S1 TaxID=718288 RepID=UPI003D764284
MASSRQRRFPRARSSVPAARTFALEALAEWGITDRRDEIRLCVSELATNALLHGVPAVADDFGVDEHVVGKTVWSSFKIASARGGGR